LAKVSDPTLDKLPDTPLATLYLGMFGSTEESAETLPIMSVLMIIKTKVIFFIRLSNALLFVSAF
jgi:hypothetical protein